MHPIASEDHALNDMPQRPFRLALADLAVSAIVVGAIALLLSFIPAA